VAWFADKFIILKYEDVDQYLDDATQSILFDICGIIKVERGRAGKPINPTRFVINTDEPYAQQIAAILVENGHYETGPTENGFEVIVKPRPREELLDLNNLCATCRWWDARGFTGGRIGYCRRFPPKPTTSDKDCNDTLLPMTRQDDYCGEYKEDPNA